MISIAVLITVAILIAVPVLSGILIAALAVFGASSALLVPVLIIPILIIAIIGTRLIVSLAALLTLPLPLALLSPILITATFATVTL